jgi:lipopolysaccharide/colanic/teichoic acid biosynthesis glycosyltransferase
MNRPVFDPLKRGLDFLGAAVLGVILLPVFIIVALLILLLDGKPILFTQLRPGRSGRPFTLYKFRTMQVGLPSTNLSSEKARVSKLGMLLRTLSLDELPQLWNVLRGDMSFVGPRPLLMEYLPLYNKHQARRHEVRPGISGLAQVRGRNHLSWEEKFDLDVQYVESRSFRLDFLILMKSLMVVFSRRGIAPARMEWVDPFRGSPS